MKTQSYRRVGTSKKRAREARAYRKEANEFLDDTYLCFKCGEWIPRHLRTNHHFFGRVGELLTWLPGFRMACRECHSWIENNRKLASKLGYRAPERLFGRPSLVFKLYGE